MNQVLIEVQSAAVVPESREETAKSRFPVGIGVLSALLILGGSWMLLGCIPLLRDPSRMDFVGEMLGAWPALVLGLVVLQAVLAISSGIGLALRAKWGWWIAAFLYTFGIASNAISPLGLWMRAETLGLSGSDLAIPLVKAGVAVVIQSLILVYVMRKRSVFGVGYFSAMKSVGLLFAIAIQVLFWIGIVNETFPWR